MLEETIPAGDDGSVFEFDATEGQSLAVVIDWDRDEYDRAVGLVVARNPLFEYVLNGVGTPPVDEAKLEAVDQIAGRVDGETLIYRTTPSRRFHVPVEATGTYRASVTMTIARGRPPLPETLPTAVELGVGLADDPNANPL
ncbi:hypothetical protein [Natronorubrum sp. FCH18a]|uniref:hypothetical protein n=1 Tax=Natronorubrum sp. FCH18a TaxID=3447018 RepID=UPI003F511E25